MVLYLPSLFCEQNTNAMQNLAIAPQNEYCIALFAPQKKACRTLTGAILCISVANRPGAPCVFSPGCTISNAREAQFEGNKI